MAYLADDFQVGDKIDVLFQVDENNFNNERKVQFLLKDIRLSHPKSAVTNDLSIKLFEKIVPNNKDDLYSININEEDLLIDVDGDKKINVFDYIKEDTLDYIFRTIDLNQRDKKILDKMLSSALKRMIREPILNLKHVKNKGKREEYIKAIEELFDI